MRCQCHRHRSSVNFGGRHFCRKPIYEKLTKWRILHDICPKINKMPKFSIIFARKMPEFYMIIARKTLFPIFFLGGASAPCPSPSLTPIIYSTQWRKNAVSCLHVIQSRATRHDYLQFHLTTVATGCRSCRLQLVTYRPTSRQWGHQGGRRFKAWMHPLRVTRLLVRRHRRHFRQGTHAISVGLSLASVAPAEYNATSDGQLTKKIS